MVEVGALLMGSESELALKSRRVVPGVLARSGFTFQHPTWPEAAADLCQRWRAQRS
jgi:NAD dependent epimerase/dehydratase family enzyme